MNWYQQTIRNWQHFGEIAEQLSPPTGLHPKCLFRGQTEATWTLQSSLLRLLGRECSLSRGLEIEYQTQRQFRLQAHSYLTPPILPDHTRMIELWWSVMQHHRVLTRLLDWTASAFVGAYFAVNGRWDKDGAIWVCHAASVNERARKEFGFDDKEDYIDHFILDPAPDLSVFFEPTQKSERMVAQQGWFSICANLLKDHADTLVPSGHTEDQEVTYRKLIIPKELKRPFLTSLRTMNISAVTLFPGLDGLGESISKLVRIEGSM